MAWQSRTIANTATQVQHVHCHSVIITARAQAITVHYRLKIDLLVVI